MLSIDTNLLLYSLIGQNLGISAVRVVITDYVLVELYVLLRNPAVMAKALTAGAARDLVTGLLGYPKCFACGKCQRDG
jgi:hypothetical protein